MLKAGDPLIEVTTLPGLRKTGFLDNLYLQAFKMSCSAELSMEKGPDRLKLFSPFVFFFFFFS